MTDLDFDSDRRLFIKRLAGAGLGVGFTGLAGCIKAAPPVDPTPATVKEPPPPAIVRGRIGDLETIPLRHASGSSAEIAIQGAHVVSWKRASGDEMLFVSANSRFSPEQTIRGGIPVVFPQFAALGPLPGHGFLKTALWEVGEVGRDPTGAVYAQFRTRDTELTRELWPHAFRATMRVTLDEALSSALTVENTGKEAMQFHCALHTYLRVADLRKVSIEGLAGASYQDRTAKAAVRRQGRQPLTVRGEVNRIYMAHPGRLRIVDPARGRAILMDRAGFNDVVIWNPGAVKARTATGLADGEYLTMLAVEPAQIVPPVQLLPGSIWSGVQRLRLS